VTTPTEKFPRSAELPSQSPLFWVEQKDRYLRQLLIRDIEALTKRRLVVYYGNRFANPMIEPRDCSLMYELLEDVAGGAVDIMLETIGGYTDATEALLSTIENLTSDFRVIVANAAKSNGTLLGLAAKSIVMGAVSELGPIEPAVQNIPVSIVAAAPKEPGNFVLQMNAQYVLQQTVALAKRVLTKGMMSGQQAKVEETVKKLASRDAYFSHGSVLDHREAAQLGLNITYLPPDDEIWKRIWLLHCMYDNDCRKANLLKVFEGRARSTAIAVPPPTPPAGG
jgi:hypothetical protein